MSPDVGNAIPFARSVVEGISEKNVPFMAGSIAYQAFVSLIPLLVLVFFLVSLVGDETLAADVAATTEGFLPESGQDLLEESLADSTGSAGTSIIGLVILVWGSLKIFRGLDTAFSEIYDSTAESSFLEQLRDAAVVFGAIGFALVAATAATVVFAFFPEVPFLGLVNPLLLVVGLTVAFLPMYYSFPDVDVSVREILPGALVAAVGWAALQSLFQVYVSFAADSESAGAIGAILLLLTWLYFGGLLLLVGAVVNATRGEWLVVESDAADERDPFVDDAERERRELLERVERLERERGQLRNDLGAQRSRRYRLEDRVDDLADRRRALEGEVEELEAENRQLRRTLEARREPGWRGWLRELVGNVRSLSVGSVSRRRD